jgi:hypothetical protein
MNRRNAMRITRRLKVTIISGDKRFTRYTEDVSAGGLSIRTLNVFPENTLLTIELELPSGEILSLPGRMIPQHEFGRNAMGIQLTDKPETYIEFIKTLYSGEKDHYVKKVLSGIVKEIKTKHGKIAICG